MRVGATGTHSESVVVVMSARSSASKNEALARLEVTNSVKPSAVTSCSPRERASGPEWSPVAATGPEPPSRAVSSGSRRRIC